MKDLYSSIASSYSSLAKLVFGNQLFLAKTYFLKPDDRKKILIVGGGDGLDYIGFSPDLNGDYWELSASMLELAKRNLESSKIKFHLGDFAKSELALYDEVWLHFVLDTLSDDDFRIFMREVRVRLKPNGLVHVADFFPPKGYFQRVIHWGMLHFFRLVTKHPRKDLPQYDHLLKSIGFEMNSERRFKKGWIRSQVWTVKGRSPQPFE